jgi:hypothetical protein
VDQRNQNPADLVDQAVAVVVHPVAGLIPQFGVQGHDRVLVGLIVAVVVQLVALIVQVFGIVRPVVTFAPTLAGRAELLGSRTDSQLERTVPRGGVLVGLSVAVLVVSVAQQVGFGREPPVATHSASVRPANPGALLAALVTAGLAQFLEVLVGLIITVVVHPIAGLIPAVGLHAAFYTAAPAGTTVAFGAVAVRNTVIGTFAVPAEFSAGTVLVGLAFIRRARGGAGQTQKRTKHEQDEHAHTINTSRYK